MAKKIKIATLDAETDPFKYGRVPEPFIWGFFDGYIYTDFFSTPALADAISEFDGIIYAHNGGKFDAHFLIEYINPDSPIKIINGRIAECHIGKCKLRDSMNILPVPLSAFNKDKIDYAWFEKEARNEHMPEIRKYLESDCRYLHAAVSAFISEYSLSLTLAGAALKFWSKRLKNEVPRTNQEFYDKIKPYYFGGRVTPFKSGIFTGHFEIYDIKSAYPFAMLSDHPFGNRVYETTRVFDHELPRCFMRVDALSRGAFPFRRKNGSVDYPHGRGIFHITGHEFICAQETNTAQIFKVEKIIAFEDKINFRDYVEYFYQKKLTCEHNKDNTGRTFAKLFLNSLYGKFAANPENYEEYILGEFGNEPPEGYAPDSLIGERQLFGRPLPDNKKYFLNVAISASITGFVRAYLWRNIQKCRTVYYCDTDSIICERQNGLDIGENLGQWEFEGAANKLSIAGKKLYVAHLESGKIKQACKGVRISAAEIEKVAGNGTVTYEPDAPTFSIKTGTKFTSRRVRNTCSLEAFKL